MIFLVFISSIGFSQQIPSLQKYVNDYANILSPSDVSRINSLAARIEENTTVQVAILTIDSTQPMSIEEYAVNVFEKSGIGFKDKNNGILIVAAINDRKWRIEVGYGLEPIINDAKAGLIGRTYITPAFREDRYGDGLYDAVDATYKVIQNSGDTSFISEQTDSGAIILIVILMLVFIPLLLIIVSIFSRPKCPKCKVRMKVSSLGHDHIIFECPKCHKKYKKKRKRRSFWFFYVGGFGGHGGGGGGGGGFGGGSSGGGGASGGW